MRARLKICKTSEQPVCHPAPTQPSPSAMPILELTLGASLLHPNVFGATWIVLVVLCCFLLKRSRGNYGAVWIWFAAFGPLLVLSAVSVIHFNLSIGRIEILEIFIGGSLFAVGLKQFTPDTDRLLNAIAVALILGFCLASFEVAIDHQQRAGKLFNPINFGVSVGSLLLILMLLREKWRPICIIGAVLGAIALLLSGSRGPILFFLICAALGEWMRRSSYQLPKEHNSLAPSILRWRHFAWSGFVLVFIFSGFLVFQQRAELEAMGDQPASHDVRMELIRLAATQISQTPWLGIGADQAGKFFGQFPMPIRDLNQAHNTVINLALELGVLGAAAWIWAFLVLIWFFIRQRRIGPARPWQAGVTLTLFIFFCSMTQDMLGHSYNRKFIALSIMLIVLMCNPNRYSTSQWQNHKSAPS